MTRKMGPLAADHPEVTRGNKCHGCNQPFKEGEFVTIVAIGPGDDAEERAKARQGRAYNAVGIVAHWACVTGEE